MLKLIYLKVNILKINFKHKLNKNILKLVFNLRDHQYIFNYVGCWVIGWFGWSIYKIILGICVIKFKF